jgi:hypothetical protein
VFTARYALSPYIKQIRFVFKGLIWGETRLASWPKLAILLHSYMHVRINQGKINWRCSLTDAEDGRTTWRPSPGPNNPVTDCQAVWTSWRNLNTAVSVALWLPLLQQTGCVLCRDWRPYKLHTTLQFYLTHNTGRFQYKGQSFKDV